MSQHSTPIFLAFFFSAARWTPSALTNRRDQHSHPSSLLHPQATLANAVATFILVPVCTFFTTMGTSKWEWFAIGVMHFSLQHAQCNSGRARIWRNAMEPQRPVIAHPVDPQANRWPPNGLTLIVDDWEGPNWRHSSTRPLRAAKTLRPPKGRNHSISQPEVVGPSLGSQWSRQMRRATRWLLWWGNH